MMLATYQSIIEDAARRYAVPVSWIQAVIMTESSGNPDAIRQEPRIQDASRGLMQLLMRTARGLGYTGDEQGLFNPATNIDLGAKLLGNLRRAYGPDFSRVYSAYNSGKPDLYLTSTQVATHVANARRWLQSFLSETPAASAIGILMIAAVLIWSLRR